MDIAEEGNAWRTRSELLISDHPPRIVGIPSNGCVGYIICARMVRPEWRIVLAGESPARVGAGAPGSRLRSCGEIRAARRSVKSPCKRGEQTNGPQQSVNAIASKNLQPKGVWESRASHVTAKATDSILDRSGCWILPGVSGGGTLRKNSAEQERPYLAAKSGKDRAYKAGG